MNDQFEHANGVLGNSVPKWACQGVCVSPGSIYQCFEHINQLFSNLD